MSNVLKCKIMVFNNETNGIYDQELEKYEKAVDYAENLNIPCSVKKPVDNRKKQLIDSVIFKTRLRKDGFSHYLIDCEEIGTLTLCFSDNSTLIISKTDEIMNELNKIYD